MVDYKSHMEAERYALVHKFWSFFYNTNMHIQAGTLRHEYHRIWHTIELSNIEKQPFLTY